MPHVPSHSYPRAMFTAFFQLQDPGAQEKARTVLNEGGQIGLMGLRLGYEGKELLVVRVESSERTEAISSGSAFADMSRAESILYTATFADWFAEILNTQSVELRLTDSAGRVWWSVELGKVTWPAGIRFPSTTEAGWLR